MSAVMTGIEKVGRGLGGVVGTIYQAGRETIDTVIQTILPFIAFVALVIGIINSTILPRVISENLSGFIESIWGQLLIAIIATLPFLSPILGPGAVIAQVVGVVLGDQIAQGNLSPALALPALFAINGQVGCDFIPVGLSLAEAEAETVEDGVPAVLFSRQITGPLAVIIAFVINLAVSNTYAPQ